MHVLIVESDPDLGWVWQRHMQRQGFEVTLARSEADAVEILDTTHICVVVMNLVLKAGSALAVADYAQFKSPRTRVIFVTDTTFFSDGSIFNLVPNACAFVQRETPPADIAAMAQHYAQMETTL